MKTFQDFLYIMDFNGNQTVQDPKDSFKSLFKLIISSHQYMIDLKNESCIIYIDYLYEQYQDQTA